jgi:hypothetical protein
VCRLTYHSTAGFTSRHAFGGGGGMKGAGLLQPHKSKFRKHRFCRCHDIDVDVITFRPKLWNMLYLYIYIYINALADDVML